MEPTATDLTPTPASPEALVSERIGRYARAELEGMHGKRGRKPPEYFQLFPERIRAVPLEAVRPRVSRLAAGVVAFSEQDPLVLRLRRASPAVRKLVADLLALVGEEPLATLDSVSVHVAEVAEDSHAEDSHAEDSHAEDSHADAQADMRVTAESAGVYSVETVTVAPLPMTRAEPVYADTIEEAVSG